MAVPQANSITRGVRCSWYELALERVDHSDVQGKGLANRKCWDEYVSWNCGGFSALHFQLGVELGRLAKGENVSSEGIVFSNH